jgi:hypothetical protein
MKQTNKLNQIKKLALMLGLGGLNGSVAIAAASGMFKLENALLIAILFMAGPGAILLASLTEGGLKERIITALIAGLIATIIVMLSAGFGPKFLDFVNLDVLKLFGGVAVLFIALLIMGIKIPEKLPLLIMISGLAISLIVKLNFSGG